MGLFCSIACLLPGRITLAADGDSAGSRVVLQRSESAYNLLRNGQPYFVRGVGGHTQLAKLAAKGGNSIRTWSTDDLDTVLADAQRHDLTVCVGLWIGHERHGFDYQDEAAVVEQLNKCLAAVRKYKDHPAVLMWAIGNEMEGDGTNPAIWYAVDHIARECKKIDPNHPTMTVIAELGERKLQNIDRFCPHIDIVGVNSYGGISSLAKRYRAAKCSKPYIVTEFGPHGPWEVGKTRWGSAIEASSTAKGNQYANGYRLVVAEQKGLCLGSYAFLWGHKQETTATWFGMLLPDGSHLAAVDAMSEAWTGLPPKHACPQIEAMSVDRTDRLKPGEKLHASLTVVAPQPDKLSIKWRLRSDAGTIGTGGDYQADESELSGRVQSKGMKAVVTVPAGGGAYRLFAYAYDGHGGAAVANIPLYVDAPILPIASPKARLPLTLYADNVKETPYVPSGWMGNTTAIKMDLKNAEQPHSGETCIRVDYGVADNWGGVLWQSPPNDWDGKKPGGFNLTGATELEFWVRGAEGGEAVDFVLGVIEGDAPYRDTTKGELKNVRLTTQWQKLRIPLDGRDLTRIKTGFGWSMAGQGKPVAFYIDDIRYIAR